MSTEPRDVDIDDLRDLMGAVGMLPAIPPILTGDVSGRETLLSRILAEARAGDRADRLSPAATADSAAGTMDAVTTTPSTTDEPTVTEPHPSVAPVTPITSARRSRLGRSRRRVLTLAVAGTVALVAALGTQLSSGPQALADSPATLIFSGADVLDVVSGAAPSAAAPLTALATTALSAPAAERSGDVQRVATYAWLHVQDGDSGTISTVPTQSLWWVSADGAIQFTQVRTGAITPDGQIDPTAEPVAGTPTSTDSFPAGSLIPATLADLPRDTAALTAELSALAGGESCAVDQVTQAACLVTAVQQLFSQYVVPGDLAAAMWSVLGEQPAVSDLGSTTDRFGRPGQAVAVAPAPGAPDVVTVLIISPTDGQLLGVETIALSDPDGGTTPAVTGFTAWNTSSWVAALGD